jgi:valyl-tRNA synthetase
MLAPFIPFIAEEIWSWAYSEDPGMHPSIHRAPWPTLDEFAAIPAPQHEIAYNAALTVLDAVRRAKADANVSMAAPVAKVTVQTAAETQAALESVLDDIKGMLKIETLEFIEATPPEDLATVETTIEPPAAS